MNKKSIRIGERDLTGRKKGGGEETIKNCEIKDQK